MRLHSTLGPSVALAALMLTAGCSGAGSGAVTVDITITGDGVDRARVIPDARTPTFRPDHEIDDPYAFEGEAMIVDLPWTTTVSVADDNIRKAFLVVAFNEGEVGTLECSADWDQAEGDGTWGVDDEFLVGCGGDVSFRDNDEVVVDPSRRSVSFEARDERFDEIVEAKRVETERKALVEAATEAALPPGPVEIDGWRIELTGINRNGADVLEAHNSKNQLTSGVVLVEVTAERLAGSERASDIKIGALGGYDLHEYSADDDCGPFVPDSYLTLYGLTAQQAAGDTVTFNICLRVDEDDAADALAVVSVFLGDDEPVTVRFPDSGVTGNRDVLDESDGPELFERFDEAFTLQVTGATVNDVDLLSERLGEDPRGPGSGKVYVMVDIEVTNLDPNALGPGALGTSVDWQLESADGNSVYGSRDRCSKVFGTFLAEPGPAEGIDWNDRGALYIEPGESLTYAVCLEVDAAAAEGSVLRVGGGSESIVLATGL